MLRVIFICIKYKTNWIIKWINFYGWNSLFSFINESTGVARASAGIRKKMNKANNVLQVYQHQIYFLVCCVKWRIASISSCVDVYTFESSVPRRFHELIIGVLINDNRNSLVGIVCFNKCRNVGVVWYWKKNKILFLDWT